MPIRRILATGNSFRMFDSKSHPGRTKWRCEKLSSPVPRAIMQKLCFAVKALGLIAVVASAAAAARITTPREQLGFNLGDDYEVANYTQLEAYWKKLAAESDRMKLVDIGKTAEGRPQYMALVSSPENLKMLDHYREISSKLALAEGLT